MIENWLGDVGKAKINKDIQAMDNIKAEVYGTREMPSNPGFDQDIPNATKICDCMIRLDLWRGTTENKPDLVGKVTLDVDVRKGDHIKFKTSGGETGSRGIDDSPEGTEWNLVVQDVRIFGETKELQLKYA